MRKLRKRITILILVGLLTLGLVASASAYFTTEAQTRILGRTGYLSLRATCLVRLPRNIQPGYRETKRFRIHNDGPCPMRVTPKIIGLEWFLRASVSPSYIPNLASGAVRWISLTVWMPTHIGNPAQNKTVDFLVKFYGRNN